MQISSAASKHYLIHKSIDLLQIRSFFYLRSISKDESFVSGKVSFAELLAWKPGRYGCPRMRRTI